eukprot:6088249-Amphidinium_carterae.1
MLDAKCKDVSCHHNMQCKLHESAEVQCSLDKLCLLPPQNHRLNTQVHKAMHGHSTNTHAWEWE